MKTSAIHLPFILFRGHALYHDTEVFFHIVKMEEALKKV